MKKINVREYKTALRQKAKETRRAKTVGEKKIHILLWVAKNIPPQLHQGRLHIFVAKLNHFLLPRTVTIQDDLSERLAQ